MGPGGQGRPYPPRPLRIRYGLTVRAPWAAAELPSGMRVRPPDEIIPHVANEKAGRP
ncbi:hypothetical protein JCM4914_08350 [Streptomyces platensis subsp. malvinus]